MCCGKLSVFFLFDAHTPPASRSDLFDVSISRMLLPAPALGGRTHHPRHGFGSEFEPLPFCTCVQGLDRTDAISLRQREAPGASESVDRTEPTNRGNRA